MQRWTPNSVYEAKPWVFVSVGLGVAAGMVTWSLHAGVWTVLRSLLCFAGAALSIVGGVTLQLRQDYRARSKWRRDRP